MSTLIHFPLEPACDDYSFLDQAVADSEQGLDSFLTDSVNMPKLDADVLPSLVSSGFLHSVSSISDTSRLQLALSIKSGKLWCQARTLLLPVMQVGKMSTSELICYFSGHPAAFGFKTSLPPDNFTLTSPNKRIDKSLSDFQTGSGAVAHATLDKKQLISHTRTDLVDTIASLQHLEDVVIASSEVQELLTKFHDILSNAVSKKVSNTACILAYLFNFASRQHCKVWASQFPFLHNTKDSIPPSEACLCGHIS